MATSSVGMGAGEGTRMITCQFLQAPRMDGDTLGCGLYERGCEFCELAASNSVGTARLT